MDQALFHVEQGYHSLVLRYHHILKQRNASLRKGDPELAESWDDQLAELGESINRLRRRFIEWISANQDASPLHGHFAGMDVVLHPGWNEEDSLRTQLANGVCQDLRLKQTRKGPHKADIVFLQNGTAARHRLSRGQSKLFLLHLIILSVLYLHREAGITPMLLVDDLTSELDPQGLDLALDALSAVTQPSCQLFLTSTRTDLESRLKRRFMSNSRVFHVEQGRLQKMV